MVRIQTVAAGAGAIDGLTIAAIQYLAQSGANTCGFGFGFTCVGSSSWGLIITVLAVVLLVDSLFGLVAPKKAFYATAAISILVAGSIVLAGGNAYNVIADLGLGLTVAVFVLALVAARREPKVSEQANPMNLPVFG